jgi:starvation-inducible DNA-binding protein
VHSTKHDLPETVRQQVIVILNDRLADAIHLGLQVKQAHWNVKGPSFIALHKLFDAIYALVQAQVDEIAERVTALGGTAEGTLAAVTARSHLPAYPTELINGMDHVTALSQRLALYGKAVRGDIDRTANLSDTGTADLFTGISRDVDKQLWFLEAHLQGER